MESKVYVVAEIQGIFSTPTVYLFKNEEKARKKFEEIKESISDEWEYEPGDENKDDTEWYVSNDEFSFCSIDYDGCDHFHNSVTIYEKTFED